MRALAIVLLGATGCFIMPERHPTDRTGDGGITGDGDGIDADPGPGPHANIIFATAGHFVLPSTTDGMMNINAADAYCYMTAIHAPTTSPVRNHYYLGWLSANLSNIRDRLGTMNARAWKRVDGQPVAATLADLTSGTLLSPPNIDENGQPIATGEHTLTGTTPDGYSDPGSDAGCPQGHITIGDPNTMDARWTKANGYVLCGDTASHLYCVGYDIQDGQL